jgi:hypothetical protein
VYGQNIDHKPDLFDHKLRDLPKFTAKMLTINLIFLTINFGTWEVTKFTAKTLTINLIFSTHKLRNVPKFTAKTGQKLFSFVVVFVFCLLSLSILCLVPYLYLSGLYLLILLSSSCLSLLFQVSRIVLKMSEACTQKSSDGLFTKAHKSQ